MQQGRRTTASNLPDMTDLPPIQPRPWWKLGGLERVALMLGAAVGLAAAAPMLWLSAEAHRTGHAELTPAAALRPVELLLVWLAGSVFGGIIAALLVRYFRGRAKGLLRHLLYLSMGVAAVVVLAPLPLALVILLITRQPGEFTLYYISSGGLIGWQPGVISFVFLYTFRVLEQRRAPA